MSSGWLWVWPALALALIPLGPPVPGVSPRRPVLRRSQPPGDAVAWLLAVAAELRAGADPARALQQATARYGLAHQAARAARIGGDVAAALRADAAAAGVLTAVAAAWQLSQRTGAGLADVLENIADGHRRTEQIRRSLEVELAGPRATARLMSLLPLVGIGLAWMLGADPLTWFWSSWWATLTLVLGGALTAAGYAWIAALVRRVEAAL